jgi:hypothetical protein
MRWIWDDFTLEGLLSMASDQAVTDMQALHEVALEDLYARLPVPRERIEVHPEVRFAGSALCKADADLVVTCLLLEVKTRLGRTIGAGNADALQTTDLYQALAISYSTSTTGMASAGSVGTRAGMEVS